MKNNKNNIKLSKEVLTQGEVSTKLKNLNSLPDDLLFSIEFIANSLEVDMDTVHKVMIKSDTFFTDYINKDRLVSPSLFFPTQLNNFKKLAYKEHCQTKDFVPLFNKSTVIKIGKTIIKNKE